MACLTTVAACAASLGIGIAMLLAARPRDFWPRFVAVNVFLLFMWAIVPFTTRGDALWRWSFLEISRPGVRICLLATLKANAMLAVFSALLAGAGMAALGRALAGLHCPAQLAWLFLLMERNVHILRQEWHKITCAAKLRAFAPSLRSYPALGAILGIFFLRAHDRGQRLNEAMLLRGFTGALPFAPEASRPRPDGTLYLFTLCALLAIFWLEG